MGELGVVCCACFCTFYTSEMNTHSYMSFLFSINFLCHLYNITLSQQTRTMRSNDTLVDTPFQLISGFFHVNQGVLCC